MDVQQLADRQEIEDLLVTYAHAIDTKDWDLLRTVFTSDAALDYSSTGGPSGTLEDLIAFLDPSLKAFALTQHLIANVRVSIDGDRASATAHLFNPMKPTEGDMFFVGGRYEDDLVRTPGGWRIARRTFHAGWFNN